MMRLGLIGKKLTHSFSPAYFKAKFEKANLDASYKPFELQSIEDLEDLLEKEKLNGLNVTIPFKEVIIPFLDELDSTALKIGAVNTVCIDKGKRIGYNTDAPGFIQDLKPMLNQTDRHALVLGSGGASKAVVYALNSIGIKTRIVSRSGDSLKYKDLTKELLQQYQVIVNTTPVGMHPHINESIPLPWEGVLKEHLVYDLIYNPQETLLLRKARERGTRTANGYNMLVNQAELSFEQWVKNT